MAGSNGRWLDPWPSPQIAFEDSPWTITGRVVTAWFDMPREVAERILSPSLHGAELRDRRAQGVPARLRFYDVVYRAGGEDTRAPLSEGRFREAVVALGAASGDVRGESSLFMWTDSDPYRAWGREVFGFPLLPGTFQLSGDLWSGTLGPGVSGAAIANVDAGELRLERVRVGPPIEPPHSKGPWLTPRLIYRRGGLEPADRELLVVRPTIRQSGRWFAATGDIEIVLESPHPLGSLRVAATTGDVVDGIELVVPGQVTIL